MPAGTLTSKLFTTKHIPATAPEASGKLLLVFHGLGDSLHGYTFLPQMLGLPRLGYLLVNAPDDYYGGFSWFDFPSDPVPGILRSRTLIAGLLDELKDQGVKPENILLFGFSQGCLMAMDAGLRSELPLGGVIGVSGWVSFMEEYPKKLAWAARKRPFLATHGLSDPLIPFSSSAAQYRELRDMGLDLEFKSYDKDHTMVPEEIADIKAWLTRRLAE
jgi:phospholipase/carboxylesterase